MPAVPWVPLFFILMQAEPAPPEPLPGGTGMPVAPTRPAAPPPAPVPEPADPLAPPPATTVGVAIGVGLRLGTPADDLPPSVGMAFGTIVRRRYARTPAPLEWGVEAHFQYHRFTRAVLGQIPTTSGQEMTFDDLRSISAFDFAVLQTVALPIGPVRPWAAVGGGLTVGYFSTHEAALRPGESKSLSPVAHGALGLDVNIRATTDVGLRLDYAHVFRQPTFRTAAGDSLHVFGDRLGLSLALLYRF